MLPTFDLQRIVDSFGALHQLSMETEELHALLIGYPQPVVFVLNDITAIVGNVAEAQVSAHA